MGSCSFERRRDPEGRPPWRRSARARSSPMRLPASGTWGTTIGPIVIVIDDGIPCIWVYIGDTVCVFCVFDVIEGICL